MAKIIQYGLTLPFIWTRNKCFYCITGYHFFVDNKEANCWMVVMEMEAVPPAGSSHGPLISLSFSLDPEYFHTLDLPGFSLQPWLRDFGMTAKIRAPEQFYHDLQSNIILSHAFKGLKHISTIAELEAAYPDRQFVSLNPLDLFMQTDNHDHTRTRTHNGGTSSPNLTLLSYN